MTDGHAGALKRSAGGARSPDSDGESLIFVAGAQPDIDDRFAAALEKMTCGVDAQAMVTERSLARRRDERGVRSCAGSCRPAPPALRSEGPREKDARTAEDLERAR